MYEEHAKQLAAIIEGEPWDSGGDIWLVTKRRGDGKVVVFSDETVGVYANEEDSQCGEPEDSIVLV